jgi:DNA gyrase subunit A
MLALNRGRPEQMGLREMLQAFVDFREEVVVRRTKFELGKARDRGHVLVGLAIAVANIDEFIRIIRSSVDPAEARERLCARDWPTGDMMPLIALIADPRSMITSGDQVRLSDEQARAILALTLSRLTGLGRDEIIGEAAYPGRLDRRVAGAAVGPRQHHGRGPRGAGRGSRASSPPRAAPSSVKAAPIWTTRT